MLTVLVFELEPEPLLAMSVIVFVPVVVKVFATVWVVAGGVPSSKSQIHDVACGLDVSVSVSGWFTAPTAGAEKSATGAASA
jgi:hypothetical protein